MKKYNQKKFSYVNLLITIASIIIVITACSEVKNEKKLDKQEVNKSKVKPVVSTSKPKTTKPVSELDKISTAEKNSEIKIIPNRFPYDEKKKEKKKKKN